MKKSLLFLSLVLCFGVVNAQNTNLMSARKASVDAGQKQVVNPNHVPTTFKVVNNTKDPIPAGFARVSLTAGDVWGDGSGYQLLLDADATAFGVEIPATGALTESGDVPAATYAAFEYKIPTNADGSLTTTNIVMNTTITIDVPADTYDWVVTNPTAGDRMWVAGQGRMDDYVMADGLEYNFTVALVGTGDVVSIAIVNPNLPAVSLTYDFNTGVLPADWRLHNVDGLQAHNVNMFPNNEAWAITQISETEYAAASTSWFDPAGQADRWLVTSRINLQGNNYLQFDIASYEAEYLESMEIKLSTGGTEPSDFTTLLQTLTEIPAAFNTQTIDLSTYTGTVRIAFRLISNDKNIGFLDNVKILGSALSINEVENNASFGVYPNPANDFVTISDANGAEVKVIDMLGRTLISKVVKSTNETISINDLQTGMYMIQIVKDGQTSSQKLIKR